MRDIRPFKHHRFKRKLVQIRRVNLHASVASERICTLLVRKEQYQIRLSLCGHEYKCALNQCWRVTAMIQL